MAPHSTHPQENVFQILLTTNGDRELPGLISASVQSVISMMPHCNHQLFYSDEIEKWIKTHFCEGISSAFHALNPLAYRADFARYLLLYKLGGWYFDITVRLMAGISVQPDVDAIVFSDRPEFSGSPFACSNAVLYAKPGLALLKDLILDCHENIRNKRYQLGPLGVTGPNALGRAVALHHDRCSIVHGIFRDLTPGFQKKNKAFILQDGSILALGKTSEAGDLQSLGLQGSNNYAQMFRDRAVFSEKVTVRPVTSLDRSKAERT